MLALMVPIAALNFLSGIVGGIWLAFLGYWYVIGVGLALSFGGAFIVSILLFPSIVLIVPLLSSERLASSLFSLIPIGVLSLLYTYTVMGVWAVSIFYFFIDWTDIQARVPVILWSYSASTAVWSYLAQREAQSGNSYSVVSAFFNQIGCISLMVYTFLNFRDPSVEEMIVWFAVPMAIGGLFNLVVLISSSNIYRR